MERKEKLTGKNYIREAFKERVKKTEKNKKEKRKNTTKENENKRRQR